MLVMDPQLAPLKINNLIKKYGKTTAVHQLSLTLKRGEIFGLIGPNGAGNSKTLRTILNFIKPTDGRIEIFGVDSTAKDRGIMKTVGYLAGDLALYDNMTGRQLLSYLSSLRGNTDHGYATELTDRLQATMNQPIKDLSKGNRQKIGLIQAFMSKPELIILDEPTSGLDPLMKQIFYDIMRLSSQNGSTILFSSHDLAEVQKVCQRVGFIRGGELIALEDISNNEQLGFKRYDVRFSVLPSNQDLANLSGVSSFSTERNQAKINVSGHIGDFLRDLSSYSVVDLQSDEVDLEDIFMHYYDKSSEAKQ